MEVFYSDFFWHFPNLHLAVNVWNLQARDIDKAIDGFTRAVQLDPENGEAWNNVACLYAFRFTSTFF